MHFIYQILSNIVFGLFFPLSIFHPKLRQGLLRRLGIYLDVERGLNGEWPRSIDKGPRVWFHGASAGDLIALFPVIKAFKELVPEAVIVVSTMTNSGHTIAENRLLRHVSGITFLPFDAGRPVRKALSILQPDLLVLEYTELWPNLIHFAKKRGCKVALTNGRIGEDKLSRYRQLFGLIGNPLEKMDLLMMREPVEAERITSLGAIPRTVQATGNTKLDNLAKAPEAAKVETFAQLLGMDNQVVFVAGSTHEGEEKGLLKTFGKLRKQHPELRMIIAPRYPDRAQKLLQLSKAEGFRAALRSEVDSSAEKVHQSPVVILDTMGELAVTYGVGRLVFVGGSFVPRGGQNILEPAGQGRAVLFGPHMRNFRDAVEMLMGRGGLQVADFEALTKVSLELLEQPEELEHLGQMAFDAVQKARGASVKNASLLAELLKNPA